MVKRTIIIACCMGILTASCRDIPVIPLTAKNTDTFNIPLDLRNTFYIGHLIDSVTYLHLESTGNETLTDIGKVIIQDSTIYILDKALNKNIYAFSATGKFLFKFGPGKDSTEIRNFHWFNEYIVLYDDKRGVLDFFDRQGRSVKELHIGFQGIDFIPLADNLIAFYTGGLDTQIGDNLPMVVYVDSTGRIQGKGLPVAETSALQSHKNDKLFFYYDHLPYCMPSLQNNMYHLTGKTINAAAYFNFGRFNLSLDFLSRNLTYENIHAYPFVTQVKSVLVTNDFVQINYAVQGKDGFALFKRPGNQVMACGINIMADENSDFLSPVPIAVDGNFFISIIPCTAIVALKKELLANIRSHTSDKWKLLGFDTIDANSNPVIMRYAIKKP